MAAGLGDWDLGKTMRMEEADGQGECAEVVPGSAFE